MPPVIHTCETFLVVELCSFFFLFFSFFFVGGGGGGGGGYNLLHMYVCSLEC